MTVMVPAHNFFLREYLAHAPIALAVERSLECEVLRGRSFRKPVLDVGCGDGLFARILFGPGQSVCYGLEPNERELSAARRQGVYGELLHGTAESIPLPDGFCRTIFSNSALEHIPQIETVLQELHRVLSEDGELMMTVPTDKYETYRIGYQVPHRLGLRHVSEAFRKSFNAFWQHYHCHAPHEWKALLERSGFETVEIVEYAPRRVCMFLSAVIVFAGLSVVTKKLLNRWILWPWLRMPVASLLYLILRGHLRVGCSHGGLVFLRAVKLPRGQESRGSIQAVTRS